MDESFSPQLLKKCNAIWHMIFLEECKYVIKKKKIINSINEELNLDEPEDESDDDKSKESNESGKD